MGACTSGGDLILFRVNYGEKQLLRPTFGIILNMNQIMKCTDSDIFETIEIFEFKSKYVPDLNNVNEDEAYHARLADTTSSAG